MNPQPQEPQSPLQPCKGCGTPTRLTWCAECRRWYGIGRRQEEYKAMMEKKDWAAFHEWVTEGGIVWAEDLCSNEYHDYLTKKEAL